MPYGDLEVICGPMFAGKTECLIARVKQWQAEDHSVAVLKPAVDTRYSTTKVVSHNGQSMYASIIAEHWEVPLATHLAIDEAQFLSEDKARFALSLLKLGKHIVVAGLDLNSSGEPFGPMPLFLAHADVVMKLRGKCARCGNPSTRSQNLTPNTEEILVGGPESYEPRCGLCFSPTAPQS